MALIRSIMITLFLALTLSCLASDQPYIAYSLREAQNLSRQGKSTSRELIYLGGITRIVGMVYDEKSKDIILVGRQIKGQPQAHLDDLVTALRARLLYDEWPLVSIDPTSETFKTGRQKVNFKGRIADSQFGKDFLDSDIILKKYSLEQISTIGAVQSYKSICLNAIKAQINAQGAKVVRVRWLAADSSRSLHGKSVQGGESLQTRFWFYPLEPTRIATREGVFCIKELRLGVKPNLDHVDKNGLSPANHSFDLKSSGDAFAKQFTEHFQKLTSVYPPLRRLKILYDLVAVADGIKNIQNYPDLTHFLEQYKISPISTLKEYDAIRLLALVERSDGKQHAIQISGGIDFTTDLQWLNRGDLTPLRDVVLKSRPRPDALTWLLPLQGWKMPNSNDLALKPANFEIPSKPPNFKSENVPGFSLITQSVVLSDNEINGSGQTRKFFGFPPPPPPPPLTAAAPQAEYVQSLGGIDIAPEPKGKQVDLKKSKENILKSRSSKDSLSYPIKIKKQD